MSKCKYWFKYRSNWRDFRLVYKILNYDIHNNNKCLSLGIGKDQKYKTKLRSSYYPYLLIKNFHNLTYEEIDFVSKGIRGCINK